MALSLPVRDSLIWQRVNFLQASLLKRRRSNELSRMSTDANRRDLEQKKCGTPNFPRRVEPRLLPLGDYFLKQTAPDIIEYRMLLLDGEIVFHYPSGSFNLTRR